MQRTVTFNPAEWKLVPVKPTDEILQVLVKLVGWSRAQAVYAGALAATPDYPESEPVHRWEFAAEVSKFLADTLTAADEPEEITLRVGYIRDDDGSVKHGLLLEWTEYPEEGAILLVESPACKPADDRDLRIAEAVLANCKSQANEWAMDYVEADSAPLRVGDYVEKYIDLPAIIASVGGKLSERDEWEMKLEDLATPDDLVSDEGAGLFDPIKPA